MSFLFQKIRQEKLLAGFAVVIFVFLLLTTISKTYSAMVRSGAEIEMGYIIFRAVLIWGIVALFVPVFIWLAQKFSLEGPSYFNIAFHIFFSLLFVPVHALIYRTIMVASYEEIAWTWESFSDAIPQIVIWVGIIGPLSYWSIIGAFYFKKYYDQYRERQLKNSEMEAELASIRLHVLKVQLHPHFLFNTLHNINSLIHENPGRAKRVLNLLRRFLQTSIKRVNDQEVLLEDELAFTGTYLDIEKIRFDKRLSIEKDIEEEALKVKVPSFLIQPLVENAIKHGISNMMEPGKIRIISKKRDGYLVLTVEDNGPGLSQTMGSDGVGLTNIKQRLNQLYADAKFELLSSSLGGLKVNIEIPFHSIQ